MTLIVTTAIEKEAKLVKRAQDLAQLYGGVYQDRGKRTMKQIYRQAEGTLVLNKNELIYYDAEGQKLFFHPNTVGSKARFHTFFAGAHAYCNAIAKIPARNDKKPTGLFLALIHI